MSVNILNSHYNVNWMSRTLT